MTDPRASLAFPIGGTYRGNEFILSGRNLELTFSFGDVPLERFDVRGRMGAEKRVKPGAALYAEAICAKVPTYGPVLAVATRLCNQEGKLVASGTFITKPYAGGGAAATRPAGVSVSKLDLVRPTQTSDGSATARLKRRRGARYPARSHAVHILLTDASTGDVVPITYRKQTTVAKDSRGNVASVRLSIPAGTDLPPSVRAYVVADVYPLLVRVLG